MREPGYGESFLKALEFAADRHRGQFKKRSGIPYISHLLTVSALVWEAGGDETEATAALLHDVVEDGKASLDEVRSEFDEEVAEIVWNCSDVAPDGPNKPPWFNRKVEHINNLAAIGARPGGGPTMRVVGADKLANVRSIHVDARSGLPDLWDRFNGGMGGSAWYYAEMSRVVTGALPGTVLASELAREVDQLITEVGELRRTLGPFHRRVAEAIGTVAISDGLDATDDLAFELARVAAEAPSHEREHAVAWVLLGWLGQRPDGDPSAGDLAGIADLCAKVMAALKSP